MSKHILIIQGHPDASQHHFCHALDEAYTRGADSAGFEVKRIDVAQLDFPLLRSQHAWEKEALPHGLEKAQALVRWADHLVFIFPLWLGDMPALLKGFLEQIARPGFAFKSKGGNPFEQKGLTGKSARIVVTMGMPALLYRWYFRAHSIKSLERNILSFVGIGPISTTLIGMAGNLDAKAADIWLI